MWGFGYSLWKKGKYKRGGVKSNIMSRIIYPERVERDVVRIWSRAIKSEARRRQGLEDDEAPNTSLIEPFHFRGVYFGDVMRAMRLAGNFPAAGEMYIQDENDHRGFEFYELAVKQLRTLGHDFEFYNPGEQLELFGEDSYRTRAA